MFDESFDKAREIVGDSFRVSLEGVKGVSFWRPGQVNLRGSVIAGALQKEL